MKSVKINLARYEAQHGLLASRGAPRHLLRHKFDLVTGMLTACRHPSFKPILPQEQLDQFVKCLREPTRGSFWITIGSPDGDTTALLCALAIMVRAMDAHAESPGTSARPYLHQVFGGRYDKLRDDENFRSRVGGIGTLILNNVAVNSTPDKLEKTRDLLTLFSGIPRVLVVAGADPLQFCVEQLYMRPTRVLNLGVKRAEKQL